MKLKRPKSRHKQHDQRTAKSIGAQLKSSSRCFRHDLPEFESQPPIDTSIDQRAIKDRAIEDGGDDPGEEPTTPDLSTFFTTTIPPPDESSEKSAPGSNTDNILDFGNQADASQATFQPFEVQFDDEEEDEHDEDETDEDEFYHQNPVEQEVESHDDHDNFDNIDKEIEVDKSLGFKDFDDEPTTNSSSVRAKKFRGRRKWPQLLSNVTESFYDSPRLGAQPSASYGIRKKYQQVCALFIQRAAGGGCITYQMVESAIRMARRLLRFQNPRDLNSDEPSESTMDAVGELVEWTTRVLARRYQLTSDEINFGLEQIEVRRTSLWRNCPALFRSPPNCQLLTRFRSHTGQCNNPIGPHLGSSYTSFVRMLPPEYADGVGLPRRATHSNGELPPPRLLALELHPDADRPSSELSVMFMAWGQLINHDLALASGARPQTGHDFGCCPVSRATTAAGLGAGSVPTRRQRVCMPIQIGLDDPVYAPLRVRCHDFKRSIAGLRPGCSLGPRTQANMITSFVDASFVYGSTRSATSSLRNNRRGQLLTWNYFSRRNLKPLLPPQTEAPDDECVGRRGRLFCFRSGDPRTNQQILLTALHTVHTRQHNRLAEGLAQVNPHWQDQRLYHEARHVHIALVQHILLSEYLPALLGPELCASHNLEEAPAGSHWDHYDPQLNPGVSQAFAAAAFRQGHSSVPGVLFRFSRLQGPRRAYLLRSVFRQPWPLYEPGALDEFLLGALLAPSQSLDPFISTELSGHLLQAPGEQLGLDLSAINIQRGRDQGLAGYNAFRDWCGLKRAESFGELDAFMSNASSQRMAQLYEHVDDIDLFTGGISEFPAAGGALVGPTFACIIGRQFAAARAGDRLWFESSAGPHAFSAAQLESIKSVSLSRLLCANSDGMLEVQERALHLPHPVLNPLLTCDQLPDLDLSLWRESPAAS